MNLVGILTHHGSKIDDECHFKAIVNRRDSNTILIQRIGILLMNQMSRQSNYKMR
jgi:hypothetical protein